MVNPPDKPREQNPADIAREAFRRLALRRIAPTPDAYREIYEEIAGSSGKLNAEWVLMTLADSLVNAPVEFASAAEHFRRAVKARDWEDYSRHLTQLIKKYTSHSVATAAATPVPGAIKPVALKEAPPQAEFLRDLLSRTLIFAVVSLLQNAPELARESEELAQSVKEARTDSAMENIAVRLKQLCFKIEMNGADMGEQQEMLLRLFRLLLENLGELLEDDSWLRGQIDSVHNLLTGPIHQAALQDAARTLKEVIYKQGLLKHSLAEAKSAVKNMMITFVDRLSAVATSTSDYHEKMAAYSQKISQTTDILALNQILGAVMHDTRSIQLEALRSRDEMLAARQEVQKAESRIQALEAQLEQMSDQVREDQLTGSLNRRGLEDAFERESARADRRKMPLCIALLDLDDFKRLNDTHGHLAGDQALIHLVRVIKDTLRTMDVIARFGGEEFLIMMPETTLEAAMQTVTRLQRELTKRIFMHKHERLLVTFSAGVALRHEGETQAALIKRADDALYRAKHAGKNRVVAAE
jgi:diguanylate cyclase